MKKILLLLTILFVSVITTACINNLAIQELNNKAAAYMDKGDTETAICRLKSSLDLDDEVFQTHYNLGVAYNSIGKFEEAVNELNKVIALKPDFVDAYYTIAIAREAIADNLYDLINQKKSENIEPSFDEISQFNDFAQAAIDSFNEYLVRNLDAKDSDVINERISGLNERIKDFTEIYHLKTKSNEDKVAEELQGVVSPDNTEENAVLQNETEPENTNAG